MATGVTKQDAKKQQQHYAREDEKEEESENSEEIANAMGVFKDLDDVSSTKTMTNDEGGDKTGGEEDEAESRREEEEEEEAEGKPTEEINGFAGTGSYKFDSSEHVDEYLKALGVGLVFRKVQSAANPSMTIFPCKPQEWAIKMDSIFRTREVKFHLGEEFTDETFDGRPCRSMAVCEGQNRLVIHQRCPSGSDVKAVYEVQPDNSIQLQLTSGSHKATLFFSSNSDL